MDKPEELVEGGGDMAGVPVTDRGTWMQLTEGRIFYPLDPRPEEVFIQDIAQSLSHIIRYNGLSDLWLTVAQHSSQCAWIALKMGEPVETQLAVLMHDATETFVSDLIRPLKCNFPEYKRIEKKVDIAVNLKFNLPQVNHDIIKHYDNLSLGWEKRDMYASSREWPNVPDLPSWFPTMTSWSFGYAKIRFLDDFTHLTHAVEHNRRCNRERRG